MAERVKYARFEFRCPCGGTCQGEASGYNLRVRQTVTCGGCGRRHQVEFLQKEVSDGSS